MKRITTLLLIATGLTGCLPMEEVPPDIGIGICPVAASYSYYGPDQILVQVPLTKPTDFRITSSLGSVYDTCTNTHNGGIFLMQDYGDDIFAFTEDDSFGVNLPDKVSYEINSLGDCSDPADDTVVADLRNLKLYWYKHDQGDECYGGYTQRRAYVFLYDLP